jgi:hypothetical protein
MRGEGHGMMSMEMCRQMMAGMGGRHGRGGMGGGEHPMGMMGMGRGMGMMGMGDLPADPKQAGQVMEMRGEIMKAVGEILIKHGQRMQSAPPR